MRRRSQIKPQTEEQSAPSPVQFVEQTVERLGRAQETLIPLLQAIQSTYRYLPEEALRTIPEITEISAADVASVSSFYSQFRLRPVGKHVISVCHGTACHVKGSVLTHDALRRALNLAGEADTDADGVFTVERVACLGCCTLAPVIQIDGVTYGHLSPERVPHALEDFLALARRGRKERREPAAAAVAAGLAELRVGTGSCCVAGGSLNVRDALEQAVRDFGAPVVVKPVGCVGMCHQTPLVEVSLPGKEGRDLTLYTRVTPGDAEAIVRSHFRPRGPLNRLKSMWASTIERLVDDRVEEPMPHYPSDARDVPICEFLGPQKRIATEYCGDLSPLDIDEYLAHDGFKALRAVVEEGDPEALIATVLRSGLRGRGGAGFPTGRKWGVVRAAEGSRKYAVCNGDEGDPGAFMDRMLLESFPYRVLEGMSIAAWAVGATEGVLYIRAEYPLAVRRIREAIARCEERGFLGDGILGGSFNLHLRIMEGAGAFVCGEETALIASIEGRRGVPTIRPPYPAQSGLWGCPTLVNNVETYAMTPWIVRHGAEAFSALGTAASKGTKVFSLTGKVRRGGLIEVPMGVTIRRIVEEIGGGVAEGRRFKAVQIGGPSGGCIPAELADTPVDYEALASAGAIVGSGGLVVMDDRDCMVDIARYFLEFTESESCGQCTMCRVGTCRLREILERICAGKGRASDLDLLDSLASQVKQGSLCGLGQTAPNPVLTTLRYFRAEYEAHIAGRCPAGKCRALIRYDITDKCIGCTLCAQDCPVDAIASRPFEQHTIDDDLCTRCDSCRGVCPVDAIRVL